MIRMGIFKEKGMYQYAALSSDKVVDAHVGKAYCAICEVGSFQRAPDEKTEIRPAFKPDVFYPKGSVEFTNSVLKAKIVNGSWTTYP